MYFINKFGLLKNKNNKKKNVSLCSFIESITTFCTKLNGISMVLWEEFSSSRFLNLCDTFIFRKHCLDLIVK